MAGARLSIAPNGWRDEDCAKWLVRGLRIAPNSCEWPQHKKATIKWQFGDRDGQMKKLWAAIVRSRRPKEKIAARQSSDRAGQKKKSQRGNRGITPASSKIVARQSEYHAGHFKNRGAAIVVSRRPIKSATWQS
jgi:hypothetical protein